MRYRALLLAAALTAGVSASPPSDAFCLAEDGGRDVRVPAGVTTIGDDGAYAEERGAYEARLHAFRIDEHEVTNRMFKAFVATTGYVTTAERRGDSIVFVAPGGPVDLGNPANWWRIVKGADWRHPAGPGSSLDKRANFPVVHVSYEDARAYARWAGRALPDEEQFEYAARAGQRQSPEPPQLKKANYWQGQFPIRNTAQDGHEGTAPVGCFEANAFGLHDMIGNVWEWTRSPYTPDHRPQLIVGVPNDPRAPTGQQLVIKGGSFLCAENYCARYRPSARHAQDESASASHLGFRTVALKD